MKESNTNTILLIEDDRIQARLIQHYFDKIKSKYSLTIATSLVQAQDYIIKNKYSLIFTDIVLPDGNGLDILQGTLKENTPIIVLTGFRDDIIAIDAIKKGAFQYLIKSAGAIKNFHEIIERSIREWNLILNQKKAKKDLLREKEKYQTLYNNALVGMLTVDFNTGLIITGNKLAYKMFGFDEKIDFIGLNIKKFFINKVQIELFFQDIDSNDEIRDIEIEFKDTNNDTFWTKVSSVISIEKSTIDTVIVDITEIKKAKSTIIDLTFFDKLTKLPNIEMFDSFIQTEILRCDNLNIDTIFSIVCLGIDKFKNINTLYGKKVGDLLLVQVAEKLNLSIYKKNDKLSRFSGDQFMILFANINSQEDTAILIKKIENIFSSPFNIEGKNIDLSVSLGISLYPKDGNSSDILLKNSENAMYNAKDKGMGLYHFYDQELNKTIIQKLDLELKMKEGLLNNEFIPFYQPRVDFKGKILGMESLARWKTQSGKIISPFHFIPIAEGNGMIEQIGYNILKTACLYNKNLQIKGYNNLKVSVNLSPFQFNQTDLIDQIDLILENSNLKSEWLELEITESGIMVNEKDALYKLEQFKERGISIAIDDYGTGYSSLSKLQDYPVDILKIDKSFVDNILTNKKTLAIIKNTITLAHDLGFSVVAEGVETLEQLEILTHLKCNEYQGYYFYKPLPLTDFEMELKKQ
jgi:diguanylate cyclase (GGDEF)-like protein